MKQTIFLFLVVLNVSIVSLTAKEFTVDQKDKAGKPVVDPKTKQPKQTCKIVRRHQKLEGTKVPGK